MKQSSEDRKKIKKIFGPNEVNIDNIENHWVLTANKEKYGKQKRDRTKTQRVC